MHTQHGKHRAHQDHAAGKHLNERRLFWAMLLTGGFMIAEAIGGLLSGSLALLADAGHMLTDAAALALAWLAIRIASQPADWRRTYGFDRFQVLAAFSNGLALFFIAIAIVYEAISRLLEPVAVLAGPMLAVAIAGFIVNIAAFTVLHGAERNNLNVRGALLHVVGDLLGSVAAIAAALIILWTGWTPIDPLLSILVAVLILRSAWKVAIDAGHILLEAAPEGFDVRLMQSDLVAAIPEVEDVHHVHAWSITPEKIMVTLHARVADGAPPETISAAIKARLKAVYAIDHATVEIEHEACADNPDDCGPVVFTPTRR